MTLTILDGSTFCVSDGIGDICGPTGGFFAHDTRFLSTLTLRINGKPPLLLSSGKVEYFSAAYFLRNPGARGLPHNAVSIVRRRFVGDAMQDHVFVRNESMGGVALELEVEVGADFADIITVKEYALELGDPEAAPALPPPGSARFDSGSNQIVLEEPDRGTAHTQVLFSRPGRAQGGKVAYAIELGPRERWELRIDVVPSLVGEETPPHLAEQRLHVQRARIADSLSAWHRRAPQLQASWDALRHSFDHSVADLAALRIRDRVAGARTLPAAGMPWFMTIFGRDTIITSLQTLPLGPELAVDALGALAELQATADDPTIDAEPGKIVHEVREGRAADRWFERYYGSVDATPLYLVLLSEVWRWTDDTSLVQRLRQTAMAALEWIDRYGDLDGDGFVEFRRRTDRGLATQSWRDSGDSQRFHDGRVAEPPIAPAEVQGYVFDAKRRLAEIARDVWRDHELSRRLDREAKDLQDRFDAAFWIEDGGFYAMALDREKRRVDARCSNMGHLLWSGIVPPGRVEAVADQLLSEPLWSGWGIRTMASDAAAYNPLSYHNGTVWPHDNSLAAWGLMRHRRWEQAWTIARALLQAAADFNWSLPEVFAGYARSETPFPIEYPTAARPQAWAAATPVLLLRTLLGLEPDRLGHRLRSAVDEELPSWAGDVRLSGVRAYGRTWEVLVERGTVRIREFADARALV